MSRKYTESFRDAVKKVRNNLCDYKIEHCGVGEEREDYQYPEEFPAIGPA